MFEVAHERRSEAIQQYIAEMGHLGNRIQGAWYYDSLRNCNDV